jgi:alkanesulfonate monooxygenase SsuD/methylene tetrahydromethanopterin reductase-like flavin-dependent oxidoreductase (luciferase family)
MLQREPLKIARHRPSWLLLGDGGAWQPMQQTHWGDKKHGRQIHDGHLTFLQEEERRFVTPEAIKATCLTGEPDEIIERIRELENAGIQEIALMSPADYQRKVYRDVAELVLPAFR